MVKAEETLAETQGIVDDLEKFYQEKESEDTECVERCKSLMDEIEKVYVESEGNAKDLIEKCTTQVEMARKQAEELAAETPTSPEIEALDLERQALENRIQDQTSEKEGTEKMIKELEAKVSKLETKLQKIKSNGTNQVPMMKHSLSLFANVSKIKWDFANTDKKTIQGHIVDPDSGVVKGFSFKTEKDTTFQIANQLWDMIGV